LDADIKPARPAAGSFFRVAPDPVRPAAFCGDTPGLEPFIPTGFFATGFFASGLFATGLFATGFFATGFFATGFFATGFFATGFFGGGFFDTSFFGADLFPARPLAGALEARGVRFSAGFFFAP
jgi:hypothetical protein